MHSLIYSKVPGVRLIRIDALGAVLEQLIGSLQGVCPPAM